MGLRIENSSTAAQQRWFKVLADGSVAVGLYNKLGGNSTVPCPRWDITTNGYNETANPGACFNDAQLDAIEAYCCADPTCAGFSFAPQTGNGCYKYFPLNGFVNSSEYDGYTKPGAKPSPGLPADITVAFADINLVSQVEVFDIWAQKSLGSFSGSFTAQAVPYQGTAFLRMTQQPAAMS
jgi:hypothetical protein